MGRRLGQHFLRSEPLLARIAAAAVPSPDSTIVEIGPGRGALTRHLLPKTHRLIAIEVDTELFPLLQGEFGGKLELVEADVLKTDLTQWGRIAIAGNLPYYITSPIVEQTLRLGPLLERATFLVQLEVAERIVAPPGTRDYGYLSVLVQSQAAAKILFKVPPGAFQPPPKVDSAVFQLIPHPAPLVSNIDGFQRFAGACFQMKRKTLRNNLHAYPIERAAPEVLQQRAEQLSVAELITLYQQLA